MVEKGDWKKIIIYLVGFFCIYLIFYLAIVSFLLIKIILLADIVFFFILVFMAYLAVKESAYPLKSWIISFAVCIFIIFFTSLIYMILVPSGYRFDYFLWMLFNLFSIFFFLLISTKISRLLKEKLPNIVFPILILVIIILAWFIGGLVLTHTPTWCYFDSMGESQEYKSFYLYECMSFFHQKDTYENQIKFCNSFGGKGAVACIIDFAFEMKNKTLCDLLLEGDAAICIGKFAANSGSPEFCEEVPNKNISSTSFDGSETEVNLRVSCYMQFNFDIKNLNLQNESEVGICNRILDSYQKEECIRIFAIKFKNPEICNNLSENKDFCRESIYH